MLQHERREYVTGLCILDLSVSRDSVALLGALMRGQTPLENGR
jgi:hypothetical protein